jgi:hypothetical protein
MKLIKETRSGSRLMAFMAWHGYKKSCMGYLRESGCPWDINTPSEAAASGKLHCLEYPHKNGCEWDEDVWEAAQENGHTPCLVYIYEHGCPWNGDAPNNNIAHNACTSHWISRVVVPKIHWVMIS